MRESPENLRESDGLAVHASPVAGPGPLVLRVITSPWGERTWLRVYCTTIAMAAFLSFTGALGTGDSPAGTRLAYWLIMMLGGTMIVQMVCLGLDRLIHLELLAEAVVMFLAATLPITVFVWAVTAVFTGHDLRPAQLPFYIGPVMVITAAMSGLHYLLNRRPRQSHEFTDRTPVAGEPAKALRERLPFRYRQADILALSAEDHYLRVYTSAGETLVLMRLYDAITLMDGIEGSQTHRSWWVARAAVSDVERADGRIALRIRDNISVPVSRGYQKTLKQDGWF